MPPLSSIALGVGGSVASWVNKPIITPENTNHLRGSTMFNTTGSSK
jgi:hypothetical protein